MRVVVSLSSAGALLAVLLVAVVLVLNAAVLPAAAQPNATLTPTPTRDPDIPEEVYAVFAQYGRVGYDLYPNNVLEWSFAYLPDAADWACARERFATPPPGWVPFFEVSITARNRDTGGVNRAVFYVRALNGQSGVPEVLLCDSVYIAPTATPTLTPSLTPTITLTPSLTPTVDLTRTTATPTRRPSRTPTNTSTPRPTRTPTATFTPTITRTPSFTPTATATITLTPSATPRANSITCAGFMPSRLLAGELAEVSATEPIRMRAQPSTGAEQVRLLQPGQQVQVLEGPQCDSGNSLAWWRVQFGTQVGWIAEGVGNEYFVRPLIGSGQPATPVMVTAPAIATPVPSTSVTCPGFMPSRLVIGQQGRVLPGDPNNVRAEPAAGTTLVGQIPGGGVFIVLQGPVCDPAGRAWWQVDYQGIIGWTVEGQGNAYYTEPAGP